MPVIDGYDDLELGPKRFPEGEHNAVIKKAAIATGKTQGGDSYTALDIELEGDEHGETVRVFLPETTSDWARWEDWQRKRCKKQLVGLGIHISEVENEAARARLIGKTIGLYVAKKQNGQGTNVYFQDATGTDAGSLPEPEQVVEGSPAGTTTNATGGSPVPVVV